MGTGECVFRKRTLASSADGLGISVLTCRPERDIRGIVQLVHGMCEHKERYIPFMKYLAENGFACIIHDHRGHGESVKSSDDLGYFYEGGYIAMIEDVRSVTLLAQEEFRIELESGELPIILFGHSMGSMAVRSFAKRYDGYIDGLVVCGSPSYNPGLKLGKALARCYKVIVGKKHRPSFIQSIAFGAFNKGFDHEASDNAWICSDPEIVRAYDADPKCNFQFTTDGFINLFSLMQDAYDITGWSKRNPSLPILFVSGEEDPCMINGKRFRMAVGTMQKAGYSDVRSKTYPGMRHEILNETGKEAVWGDILDFCEAVIDRKGNTCCCANGSNDPDSKSNQQQ